MRQALLLVSMASKTFLISFYSVLGNDLVVSIICKILCQTQTTMIHIDTMLLILCPLISPTPEPPITFHMGIELPLIDSSHSTLILPYIMTQQSSLILNPWSYHPTHPPPHSKHSNNTKTSLFYHPVRCLNPGSPKHGSMHFPPSTSTPSTMTTRIAESAAWSTRPRLQPANSKKTPQRTPFASHAAMSSASSV